MQAKLDYRLDDQGSIPAMAKDSSSSLCVQTRTEAHPVSYSAGTGHPFPGGKTRPERDAYHSPKSSIEAKNEQQL
jgi:hypothetical protein